MAFSFHWPQIRFSDQHEEICFIHIAFGGKTNPELTNCFFDFSLVVLHFLVMKSKITNLAGPKETVKSTDLLNITVQKSLVEHRKHLN